MKHTPKRRPKWLVASLIFSLVGGLAAVVLLWTARGRTTAEGPVRDPGFRTEDVHFDANGNKLAGVLVLPKSAGPHPAVVFLNGSGGSDRNGYGDFPPIWAAFAKHGFACLSWDRPGVGSSTGDFETQTYGDRAAEAVEAVRFLQGRAEIRKDRVGLWGFSQGAVVAPLAASQSRDVAFVIAVSGHQLPAWQQDLYRVEHELKADGFSSADVAKAMHLAKFRMDLMRKDGLFVELDETQKDFMGRPWFEYVHYCDEKRFESGKRTVQFDAGPAWESVHCPVLAIYGAKDPSTAPEASVDVIRTGLEKAGNADFTAKIFPKAAHAITVSETGGRKEAAQRAKSRTADAGPDFAPGYLDTMTGWLATRFASKR